MTPPAFIAECAASAVARDVVVVGVRPVTDTVKQVEDGRLGGPSTATGWSLVCSPVVLPARWSPRSAEPAGPPTSSSS